MAKKKKTAKKKTAKKKTAKKKTAKKKTAKKKTASSGKPPQAQPPEPPAPEPVRYMEPPLKSASQQVIAGAQFNAAELRTSVLPRIGRVWAGAPRKRSLKQPKHSLRRATADPWYLGSMVYAFDHSEAMRRAASAHLRDELAAIVRGGGRGPVKDWYTQYLASNDTKLAQRLAGEGLDGLSSQDRHAVLKAFAKALPFEYVSRVVHWLHQLGHAAAAYRVNPVDFAELLATLDQGGVPGSYAGYLQGMRQTRLSSRDHAFVQATRFLDAIHKGVPIQPISLDKAHPWRPPSRATTVFGLEVTEIAYSLPQEFTADGKVKRWSTPITHPTAAAKISRFAADRDQYQALLGETAAGRLYLCFDSSFRRMFFATDRKPVRSVFPIGGTSPKDRAIFLESTAAIKSGDRLFGLTI